MKPFLLLAGLSSLCFLNSCQNNNGTYEVGKTLNDSTSVTGLTGDSVKLVKTAGIRFKVKEVEQSVRAVATLANKYGGAVHYHSFQSIEGNKKELNVSADSLLVIATVTPQADITVRVPARQLETFLFEVTDLGYFTGSSEVKIDDKSLDYLQRALQQKAREEILSGAAGRKASTAAVQQTIHVKDEAIQQSIANKAIDADVAYSTVQLHLFQNAVVRKEMIANDDLGAYDLPFRQRLTNALASGWEAFLNLLLAVAHLWMFLLLILAVYFSYRYYQQKSKSPQVTVRTS